jgi:uncharacterized protein
MMTLPTSQLFVQTRSGQAVSLIDPKPNTINLGDIAHSLARLPRFAGHTKEPYSVAQHCVAGANAVFMEAKNPVLALHFLMHDAHEAYIGDMLRPVELLINTYLLTLGIKEVTSATFPNIWANIKNVVDEAIYHALDLPRPSDGQRIKIKGFDQRMLGMERRIHMSSSHNWGKSVEQAHELRMNAKDIKTIWQAKQAEAEFLAAFTKYSMPFRRN